MSDRDDRDFILGMRTGKQNHAWATVMADEPRTYLDGTPKGCVEAKVPSPEWTEPTVPDYREGFTPEQSRMLDRVVDQEYVAPHVREWGKAQEPTELKFIDYQADIGMDRTQSVASQDCIQALRDMAKKYNIKILHAKDYCAAFTAPTKCDDIDYDYAADFSAAYKLATMGFAQQQNKSTVPLAPEDFQSLKESLESKGIPMSTRYWREMAGIDQDAFDTTGAQPIGVDKTDLFANGVVGIPRTTPDKTVAPVWPIKMSLDGRDISSRVVAGSVALTEPYYGSGVPNLQFNMLVATAEPWALKLGMKCLVEIAEPAPLGALTSTWFTGSVECFFCLDDVKRAYETKLMAVKCQGIGVKEDKMLPIKNNSDQTIHLPGGTAVPPSTPKANKSHPVEIVNPRVWIDKIEVTAFIEGPVYCDVRVEDVVDTSFRECWFTLVCPTMPLAHQVKRGTPVMVTSQNHTLFPVYMFQGNADNYNLTPNGAGFRMVLQCRVDCNASVMTTQAHQGVQPNIPKSSPLCDTEHRTDFAGQPNLHGEHEYYWTPGLFAGESARREAMECLAHEQLAALGFRTADSVAPPQVDDLYLHGIASLDNVFTLHGPGGEVQMELHTDGDDILVLHLRHRGSNNANPVVQPVLWVKRWGEVEVAPGLHHHMGDLAQGFWRAVAQVHRDLPQPVSPKQEAILAFLNERHMTLAEFDQQWYARPAIHMDVLHEDERAYLGTEQDPTAWAIVRIER